MSPSHRDSPGEPDPAPASRLSEADRILLLAARAWTGAGGEGETPQALATRLWDRLGPSWGHRLRDAWERGASAATAGNPRSVRDAIRRAHQAEARVDAGRVHPSWWVRALRGESPAVQRVVAATAPEPVRHAVQAGLLLDNEDLIADRAGDEEVRAWVLSLWTERLVGGEPERADDPPVIVAMTRLSPRAGYHLCAVAGLAKLAVAGQEPQQDLHRRALRARWEWLLGRLATPDRGLREQALRDVQAGAVNGPSRHAPARIGLLTLARLLADCEPFRVRWALQHWPYPLAKLTRALMASASQRSAHGLHEEFLVLRAAWDRLALEGRLPLSWPGPN
jgi:hypothetical protein